jgi:hypothetical protein
MLRTQAPIRAILLPVVTILLAASAPSPWLSAGPPEGPADLARKILDDGRPEAERKQLITDHPQLSLSLLKALISDMPANDSKEEYRRIPWIWRVTVAAGKRNHIDEMRPIVDFCVPQMSEPLRDWQAVVLGGGIINGIGLSRGWPDEQIHTILAGTLQLHERWTRLLKQAAVMADNQQVFKGTRYDALRILGLETWDHGGAQLFRYLVAGVDDELQQGAIGGLSDMRSPCIAQALLSGFAHYAPENRGFVLKALLRDRARTFVLLEAIEAGTVKPADLGSERIAALINNADPSIRERSRRLFVGAVK